MTEIFSDANEKYVKTVVFYGHESDTKLYVDKEMKQQASYDEAMNACMKGMAVILYGGAYLTPLTFRDNSNKVTVNVATVGSSALTVKTLDSKVKGQ